MRLKASFLTFGSNLKDIVLVTEESNPHRIHCLGMSCSEGETLSLPAVISLLSGGLWPHCGQELHGLGQGQGQGQA